MLPRLLFVVALLQACADFSYRSTGDYHGGPIIGPGSYLCEVLMQPGERFNLLFSRKPVNGAALLTAISTGGKPIFRALDTLDPAVKPKLELLAGNPYSAEQVRAFYEALRPLLLLDDDPARPQPLVKRRHADDRPSELAMPGGPLLTIREYDWEGHAFRVALESGTEVTLRQYQITP